MNIDGRNKALVVMQSSYVPWIGFFSMLQYTDLLVILDDVNFDKNGWRNRNRVLTSNGWKYLTVPVKTSGLGSSLVLSDVTIQKESPWIRKHIGTLSHSYGFCESNREVIQEFTQILDMEHEYLVNLNQDLLNWINQKLDLKISILQSSNFQLPYDKNLRLLKLMRELGRNQYITGPAAGNYLNEQLFHDWGFQVQWFSFDSSITYSQIVSDFESGMSILDYMLSRVLNAEMPKLCDFGKLYVR